MLQNEGEIVEVIAFRPGAIHWNSEKPQYSYDADVLVRMPEAGSACYGELPPASETN